MHLVPNNNSYLRNLYSEPLINFTNAHSRLQDYQNKPLGIHQKTKFLFDKFLLRMSCREPGIDDHSKNLSVMKSIISTIIFCGRQALPL